MDLQKMLNKGRIDCFKMAEQSYFETKMNAFYSRQTLSIYEGNPSLTDNFYGAQLALIAEYYLKGILLPVLEITVPEDDENIKNIANQLTDKQKYQILSSDASVITELQQLYGGTGASGRKIFTKLGKESLQTYGHDLNELIKKIIEKAEQGKFRDAYIENLQKSLRERIKNGEKVDFFKERKIFEPNFSDENTKSFISDSWIKKSFNELLNNSSDETVKKAFPEGRYGHLNNYVANVNELLNLVERIRQNVIDISAGIELVLDERKGGPSLSVALDRRIEFPDDLKYITVSDLNYRVSRIFEWKDNKLKLKYGIEENDKRDMNHFTASFLEGHRIFLNPGEKVQFFYENKKTKTYITSKGKIEKTQFHDLYKPFDEREPRYYSEVFRKSANNVEKNLTDEVTRGGYMQSRLAQKYVKYYYSTMRLHEKQAQIGRYKIPNQKNSILRRILEKERAETPERRASAEFRKAYVRYLGDKLSYRVERGRQIFLEMMSYLKKGELKSEILTALKELSEPDEAESFEER